MIDSALRERLHAFGMTGDVAILQAMEAGEEEATLRESVGDLRRDPNVMRTIGLIRWARCLTGVSQAIPDDLAEVARCLGYLVRISPDEVSPLLGIALSGRDLAGRVDALDRLLVGAGAAALDELREFCSSRIGAEPDPVLLRGTEKMNSATALLLAASAGPSGLSDVDAAIGMLRSAVPMLAAYPRHSAEVMGQLGCALFTRFRLAGDQEALLEAQGWLRPAVEALRPRHPSRAIYLSVLGAALCAVGQSRRDVALLREAVECGRAAVEDLDEDEDRISLIDVLNTHTVSLTVSYQLESDPALLDDALGVNNEALRLMPESHPSRWLALRNKAVLMLHDYERGGLHGTPESVEETARAAVAAAESDHATGLAEAAVAEIIWRLTLYTGDASHLEDWMTLDPGSGPGPRRLPSSVDGSLALRMASLTGNRAPADELLDRIDGELATETDPRMRAGLQLARGWALFSRLLDTSPSAARDAAEAFAEVLRSADEASADRQSALIGQAIALHSLFLLTSEVGAGHDAARSIADAIADAGPGHPYSAVLGEVARQIDDDLRQARGEEPSGQRSDLSALLATIVPHKGPPADDRDGTPLLLDALQLQDAGLAALAAGDQAGACLHLERLIAILSDVVSRPLRDADRARVVAQFDSVPTTACAAALGLGDPPRALEMLETGRGALLAAALETHLASDEVLWRAPDLVKRFEHAQRERARALDQPARAPGRHEQLTKQWDEVIEEIRKRPGLEEFLRPPDEARLRALARNGSIVTFCVTEGRTDALVVTPDMVRAVALSEVDQSTIRFQADRWRVAWNLCRARDMRMLDGARAVLRDVLGWLWDHVTGPVLDSLGHEAIGSCGPRLWWAASGALSRLPIHAAGHHDGSGRSVMDRVVSSMTPGLHALAHTRMRESCPTFGGPLVVVVAGDGPALPHAVEEASWLRDRFPESVVLQDDAATRAAVMAAIPGHTWVHFACHAAVDPEIPSNSGLALADGLLRIRDIARLSPVEAELAFLSACGTAAAARRGWGPATVAEAVQVAGFRHVIATLWQVQDKPALQVAKALYTTLAPAMDIAQRDKRDGEIARALHKAVLAARHAFPDEPDLWAAHVHAGP